MPTTFPSPLSMNYEGLVIDPLNTQPALVIAGGSGTPDDPATPGIGSDPNTSFPVMINADPSNGITVAGYGPSGQQLPIRTCAEGRPIVLPYAHTANTWQWSTAGTAITGTTAAVMKTAPTDGRRNYLTALQVYNSAAAVNSEVQVLDGATVIWDGFFTVGTIGQGLTVVFPVPLRASVGNALSLKMVTTSTSTYASAQGFVAQ